MTEYDNTNRGALFKNDRKDSDKHPDYRGDLNVNGRDYRISAWLKTARDGRKFMSLSVKPKDETGDAREPDRMPARGGGSPMDEVPFAPEWR